MLIFVVNCSFDNVFIPCFLGFDLLWVFARWLRRFRCFITFRKIRSTGIAQHWMDLGGPKKIVSPSLIGLLRDLGPRGEGSLIFPRLESLGFPSYITPLRTPPYLRTLQFTSSLFRHDPATTRWIALRGGEWSYTLNHCGLMGVKLSPFAEFPKDQPAKQWLKSSKSLRGGCMIIQSSTRMLREPL